MPMFIQHIELSLKLVYLTLLQPNQWYWVPFPCQKGREQIPWCGFCTPHDLVLESLKHHLSPLSSQSRHTQMCRFPWCHHTFKFICLYSGCFFGLAHTPSFYLGKGLLWLWVRLFPTPITVCNHLPHAWGAMPVLSIPASPALSTK